jgi:hypothetical protein
MCEGKTPGGEGAWEGEYDMWEKEEQKGMLEGRQNNSVGNKKNRLRV